MERLFENRNSQGEDWDGYRRLNLSTDDLGFLTERLAYGAVPNVIQKAPIRQIPRELLHSLRFGPKIAPSPAEARS
jgi:hypothetical protein